jgi:hypothetical protein
MSDAQSVPALDGKIVVVTGGTRCFTLGNQRDASALDVASRLVRSPCIHPGASQSPSSCRRPFLLRDQIDDRNVCPDGRSIVSELISARHPFRSALIRGHPAEREHRTTRAGCARAASRHGANVIGVA